MISALTSAEKLGLEALFVDASAAAGFHGCPVDFLAVVGDALEPVVILSGRVALASTQPGYCGVARANDNLDLKLALVAQSK